jgi:hypothetical protein
MTDEDQMDDFLSNSRISVGDKIVPIESRRISFGGFFVIVSLLFLLASVPFFFKWANLSVSNGFRPNNVRILNESKQSIPSFLAISKTLSDGRLMRSSAYRLVAPTSLTSQRRSFIDNRSIMEWTRNVASKI